MVRFCIGGGVGWESPQALTHSSSLVLETGERPSRVMGTALQRGLHQHDTHAEECRSDTMGLGGEEGEPGRGAMACDTGLGA